ncbi:hypothetical protein EV688_104192 [Chromatocurvus halotolerans]|uniref:Uncharacterized protein n=1 Tax=Chromatocurvus halotolerans TaxID=1132028 RepID=A0A4R2KV75_9GAMM|nr:hypothetical protein EV688_104192 [Chromatocurvus halotolerans]
MIWQLRPVYHNQQFLPLRTTVFALAWIAQKYSPKRCGVIQPYWYFQVGMLSMSQPHNQAHQSPPAATGTLASSRPFALR